MREVFVFRPPRRKGTLVHGAIVVMLVLIGLYGLWKASGSESGPAFLIYLLITIASIALIPSLVYRIYALQRARYELARDGISLYWGLRREEIPINEVNWIGPVDEDRRAFSKPFLRIPGGVLGVLPQEDGKPVEFLASRASELIMIVTSQRIFAISPAHSTDFLQTYRRLSEFGSLAPIRPVSDYPAIILSRSWADRPARLLLILSSFLALGLILWVSFNIPSHPQVSLRLNLDGSPIELVPGIRLLLLPVLNTVFFILDLILGLFFYRREDTRSLAYLMWTSSALTSCLFIGAVYFILRAV